MATETAREHAHGPRRALVQGGAVLAVIVVALVVIGVIAHARAGADAATRAPTGWQDGSAPTNQPLAAYAASHLTPGLIVGIVGGPTGPHLSADPLGTARVWRSQDSGVYWQAIATNYTFVAGATISFVPGSDMLVAVDTFSGTQSTPYLMSRDDGTTWQKLVTPPAQPTHDTGSYYGNPSGWFFRDGTLYAMINGLFAASLDDGMTWTTLEHATAQPGAEFETSITPDYHAPQAWLRVQNSIANNQQVAQIEHSVDNGRTWVTLPPLNATTAYPAGAQSVGARLSLATNPAQPGMLCVAFSGQYFISRGQVRAHIAPMPNQALFLGRSTDDGATWQLAQIAQASDGAAVFTATDGGTSASLTDTGDCLALTAINSFQSSTHLDSTLWRLPMGATHAETVFTLSQWTVAQFAVLAQPHGERIFVTATPSHSAQITYCTSDATCYDHFDPVHLLWRDIF